MPQENARNAKEFQHKSAMLRDGVFKGGRFSIIASPKINDGFEMFGKEFSNFSCFPEFQILF